TAAGARLMPAVAAVPAQGTTPAAQAPAKPAAPPIIPAVAPIRVLQSAPAKPGGLVPDIKLGSGAKLKPYGFFKTSVVYDTSNQQGNDFPLPGFLGDTGPGGSPEFHLKARGLRIGTNFEWPDIAGSKNLAITGRLEFDFEGNFTRVSNRNISAIRSSQPSIRLAWVRLDNNVSDKTAWWVLLGQDWTPFGSSTLPNLLETTGLGIGFGSLYERNPQVRVGLSHNFGGSRNFTFIPEVAVVLPAFGNLPGNTLTVAVPACAATPCPATTVPVAGVTGVENQLAYGERQGVDSERPEIEGRLVWQFQLDKAKGVAPAQFIVSGMYAKRRPIIIASAVPLCVGCPDDPVDTTDGANTFRTAFPTGAEIESNRYGATAEIQLPTRYVTFLAKYYNGRDLRFWFASQVYTQFNNTIGLTNTATATTIDGTAPGVVFGIDTTGLRSNCQTVPVLAGASTVDVCTAEQFGGRTHGGFVNLGFPLSRIFNADPAGRHAGWTLYLHYGYDAVYARDVRRFSPAGGRGRSDLMAGNIQYKLNQYVTFGYEGSLYRTRAYHGTAFQFPLFRGTPQQAMHDFRSEFATIFTF
ncbi:MAG TPA: hypothetical protein VGQ71_07675, partial [Terriglobales bacterium]|nr:hypothetical protein [Terriglobales bacterium]